MFYLDIGQFLSFQLIIIKSGLQVKLIGNIKHTLNNVETPADIELSSNSISLRVLGSA